MKDNFEKRSGRLIVVDGVKWKWKVGKCNNVVAYSEFGEKKLSNVGDIMGRDSMGRCLEYGRFTPYDVAQWINGKPVTKASPKSLGIDAYKKMKLLDAEDYNNHGEADKILCELLIGLGHEDVVKQYRKIYKYYA